MLQKTKEIQSVAQSQAKTSVKRKTDHSTEPTKKHNAGRSIRRRLGADGQIEPQITYLDHAPMHPAYCHANGLFRPLPKDKKSHPLDVSKIYTMRKHKFLGRWVAPEGLNIVDQCVLFFLCKLAAQPGQYQEVNHLANEGAQQLNAMNESGVHITTTLRYDLAPEFRIP